MRIARFTTADEPAYGVVSGDLDDHGELDPDAVVTVLEGDPEAGVPAPQGRGTL